MATVTVNLFARGWEIQFLTAGSQPRVYSDIGEIDQVRLTSIADQPGCLRFEAVGSVTGGGESVDTNVTIDNGAGTVIGSVTVKGAGKGR